MVIFFWFVFSLFAGAIAHNKRRSGIGFFLLAVVLSPFVGIIAALIASPGAPDRSGQKKCPQCAEWVMRQAKVCKHCGTQFDEARAEPDEKPCPHCGQGLSATASTCGKCGRILSA